MKHFLQIAAGIDMVPLAAQILRNPQLWNANTLRRDRPASPHEQMADIWVRYRDDSDCRASGDYAAFETEHTPVWYPAWHALPALRPIVFGLMARLEAVALGGVLITRIPAGERIAPHVDGNWHAKHFGMKVYVPIMTNDRCWNRCEDEVVTMAAGSAWHFNNLVEHEVRNDGTSERMTLIVCLRCE